MDALLAFPPGPRLLYSFRCDGFPDYAGYPLARVMLTLYVLVPYVLDLPPARYAMQHSVLSQGVAAWSMPRLFALGCCGGGCWSRSPDSWQTGGVLASILDVLWFVVLIVAQDQIHV